MSFAEKNKAWLLPLLGVGVLAVVVVNLRSGPKAEPAPTPLTAAAGPEAAPPQAPGIPALSTDASDLWADLRALAVVPPELGEESSLQKLARANLGSHTEPPPVLVLASPDLALWSSLRSAAPSNAKAAHVLPTASEPDLDFLVGLPGGSKAWFGGHGYSEGESLPGGVYKVRHIGPTRVELQGPAGTASQSTNPLLRKKHELPSRPESP